MGTLSNYKLQRERCPFYSEGSLDESGHLNIAFGRVVVFNWVTLGHRR